MRLFSLLITATLAACNSGGGDRATSAPPGKDLAATPIYDIQGAGPSSSLIGQRVTVDWEAHEELSIPLFRPA